jgi:hypothetical protein
LGKIENVPTVGFGAASTPGVMQPAWPAGRRRPAETRHGPPHALDARAAAALSKSSSGFRGMMAATPEPEAEDLYRTLGIATQIIRPQYAWTPQS